MSLDLLGFIAFMSAAPGVFLFLYFYARVSQWRIYPAGRALMYTMVSLGALFLWLIIALGFYLAGIQVNGNLAWKLIRIVMSGSISFTIWRLFFVMRRVQKAPDRDGWTADRPVEEKQQP